MIKLIKKMQLKINLSIKKIKIDTMDDCCSKYKMLNFHYHRPQKV